MQGWIKIHRKILENPIVFKDAEHFAVWAYLLLNATHKEHSVLFNGCKTSLVPGQLVTGRKSIALFLGTSESKVQRILKKLEIEQQIEQQTTPRNRLITIKNWHLYQESEQQSEQQVNNNRTTTEQQLNTNKNVRRVKNEKNVKKKDSKTSVDFKSEIEKYTQDELLTKTIFDFIDHRKAMRKEIKTATAIRLILKKLNKYSDKVGVLEQSIANGWQGIFELKDSGKAKENVNPFDEIGKERGYW